MATIVRDPNYRMVRAEGSKAARNSNVRLSGGGGGNPLSSLAASSDEEPRRDLFNETPSQFDQRHAAWAAAHQQQQMQQDVGAAITTMANVYAQTGDRRAAMAAMIQQHPKVLIEMSATGMFRHVGDLDKFMTMGAAGGSPYIERGKNGQPDVIHNFDRYGNERLSEHNPSAPPDPDKHAKPVVVNGKLVWSTPDNPTGEGREIGPAPPKGSQKSPISSQDSAYVPAAASLLEHLNDLKRIGGIGGPLATGAIAAVGAKLGVGNEPNTVAQALLRAIHTDTLNSALAGSKYVGAVRDFAQHVMPQNVYSKSFNMTTVNGIASSIQNELQGRVENAELGGASFGPRVSAQLDNVGIKSRGAGLMNRFNADPSKLSNDEIDTLLPYMDKQQVARAQAEATRRSQVQAAGAAPQAPAANTQGMPSQQQAQPATQQAGMAPQGQEPMPQAMADQQKQNDRALGLNSNFNKRGQYQDPPLDRWSYTPTMTPAQAQAAQGRWEQGKDVTNEPNNLTAAGGVLQRTPIQPATPPTGSSLDQQQWRNPSYIEDERRPGQPDITGPAATGL